MLAEDADFAGLAAVNRELIAKAEAVDSPRRVAKTGGRLAKQARYYWLMLAENHLTRRLFGSMLRRITALPLPAG